MGGLFDDAAIRRAVEMAITMRDVPRDHQHVVATFNDTSTSGQVVVAVRAGQRWVMAHAFEHQWTGGIVGEARVLGSW